MYSCMHPVRLIPICFYSICVCVASRHNECHIQQTNSNVLEYSQTCTEQTLSEIMEQVALDRCLLTKRSNQYNMVNIQILESYYGLCILHVACIDMGFIHVVITRQDHF